MDKGRGVALFIFERESVSLQASFEKKGKNNEKNILFEKKNIFSSKNNSNPFEKCFFLENKKKRFFWGKFVFSSKKNSKCFEKKNLYYTKKTLSHNWIL
jgi:hypothetical protein